MRFQALNEKLFTGETEWIDVTLSDLHKCYEDEIYVTEQDWTFEEWLLDYLSFDWIRMWTYYTKEDYKRFIEEIETDTQKEALINTMAYDMSLDSDTYCELYEEVLKK